MISPKVSMVSYFGSAILNIRVTNTIHAIITLLVVLQA